MLEYKVYRLDTDGAIAGPAEGFQCESDAEALDAARRYFSGQRLEVWQGARYVGALPAAAPGAAHAQLGC